VVACSPLTNATQVRLPTRPYVKNLTDDVFQTEMLNRCPVLGRATSLAQQISLLFRVGPKVMMFPAKYQ